MKKISLLSLSALVVASIGLTPALADPGKGNGHGNGKQWKSNSSKHSNKHHRGDRHSPRVVYRSDCPPGLAKKNPPCVPPGQAKKYRNHYGTGIGDVLLVRDYRQVRDPWRYDLRERRGWDYYRDDDRIYRVDSGTRKILAVINLINAFSN